ncbi:family S53 protease-like protein [Favolaschia claudopus]|uniref:Family S53 protease-like protein n=1 Tax=Favolaschia claudopus TaxID=2862362 RepID=A0AAW0A2Z8_9AGAR
MRFLSSLAKLLTANLVSAGSLRLILHEHRAQPPSGFTNHGPAAENHTLTLRFGLTSNNISGLEEKLLSIATPGSRDFRRWLSQDEIKTFMAPSSDTLNAFSSFTSTHGLNTSIVSPHGDWVAVTLPVWQANTLFRATYTNYTNPELPTPIIRTLSISLPIELAGHVDVIHPSTAFATPKFRPISSFKSKVFKRDAIAPADCNTSDSINAITPACLQALYNIPTALATQKNNTLHNGYGILGSMGFNCRSSAQAFIKQFRPDLPSNQTFRTFAIDGGTNPQGPEDGREEGNLDVEYTAGIASGVPLQFLTVGGSDLPTALLDTTTFLSGVEDPPTVVTTSYGDNESVFGITLATKICEGYAAASARGISILFASGDGGVNGGFDNGVDCGIFVPVFPASCPWVTAVGSTVGFNPEVAVDFSGGGFSNLFPTPSYQQSAVAQFLKVLPSNFPGNGKFNQTSRAYPDLSIQGQNFLINWIGEVGAVGGTSASSPVVAAIVSLINEELLATGKPVLGFLNPFLYTNPSAFNDIKIGHNSGLACPASSDAFDAVPGWDPLSGLGTPNYQDLLAAALV